MELPKGRCPNCETRISVTQALLGMRNIECRKCHWALRKRDRAVASLAGGLALAWLPIGRGYGLFSTVSVIAFCFALAVVLFLCLLVEVEMPD